MVKNSHMGCFFLSHQPLFNHQSRVCWLGSSLGPVCLPGGCQMDVAASYNQRLPWPAVMDVSPEDRPVAIRTSSTGSTPLDTHAKRLRSEPELDSCPLHEPDEPPLKRMEFTPCHSPTRAEQTPPEDMASVMPPRRLASLAMAPQVRPGLMLFATAVKASVRLPTAAARYLPMDGGGTDGGVAGSSEFGVPRALVLVLLAV